MRTQVNKITIQKERENYFNRQELKKIEKDVLDIGITVVAPLLLVKKE